MDTCRRAAGRSALALLSVCVALLMSLGASSASAAEGTGAIAGTVRAASSHEPLGGIAVTVYEAEGPELPAGFATTKANGEYVVHGLSAGAYKLEFSAGFFEEENRNYVTQFYSEASTQAGAARVTVLEGATTHEINAELLTGGKIAGTVTEAEGGAAVANVEVRVMVYESSGARTVGFAVTNASGRYTVEGLESGSYYVEFSPGFEAFPGGEGFEEEGPLFPEGVSGRNLIGQLYPGARDFAEATLVHVVREATTEGIDARLLRGAEIEGTVTDASTHAPIQGALVVALGPGETVVGLVLTDHNGHYVLAGLESGSYVVAFEAQHYTAQFYSGQPTYALASLVGVTRPLVTSAINAALFPKAPANATAPVASGTPAVGQRLSCTPGAWTGSPTPTYAYAWLRDGVPIPGAAAATYIVQAADEGNGVTCRVTATNRNGSAAAISNTLIVPVPTPPQPTPALRVATSHVFVRGGSARVALLCARARCAGRLEIIARVSIKRRHRRTRHETELVGVSTYAVEAGQTATVVVPLNSRGKYALAHARNHRVRAEVHVTVAGGRSAKQAVQLSAVRHH